MNVAKDAIRRNQSKKAGRREARMKGEGGRLNVG